jgi:hypothetical protein
MLIAAVVVAAIAIAALVREPRGASKSPAATHDAHTTALQTSGQPAGAAASSREAMPSREVMPSTEVGRQDASSPADADDSATSKTSPRVLSEAVNELFFVRNYCNVTSGGDENLKQRCQRAGALAEQIVNVPKTPADSWAYGMESELDRHLTELSRPDAGWGVVERKEVRCNALGCVVYMEGPARWGYSFARLISAINSDPLIAQLNEQRRWPAAGAWDQKVNDRALLVLPRR